MKYIFEWLLEVVFKIKFDAPNPKNLSPIRKKSGLAIGKGGIGAFKNYF